MDHVTAVLLVTLAVQLLRKAPVAELVWRAIPDGARFLVPLAVGALEAVAEALAAGAPLEALGLAALRGAVLVGVPAMGVNAALTESPLPWHGGRGGKPPEDPKDPPPGGPRLPTIALAVGLSLLSCDCSPQRDARDARAAAELTYIVLSTAYQAQGSALILAGACDEAPDAASCPAIASLERLWAPTWQAWDIYAEAVERGEGAADRYCELVILSPVRLPAADECGS